MDPPSPIEQYTDAGIEEVIGGVGVSMIPEDREPVVGRDTVVFL